MKKTQVTVRYDIPNEYLSVVIIIPMKENEVHSYFGNGEIKVAEGKSMLSTMTAARDMLTKNIDSLTKESLDV